MKPLDYLDFFARLYHLDPATRRRHAQGLMERFGLGDAFDRRLGEFSKGMKQKLALVRAMLHDPPVLLLDEPTSAMDPQSAKLVREAIKELRREERTIAITTHNLIEAEDLADHIAVIRQGRIIAHGTFAELSGRFVGAPLMELRLTQHLNGAIDALREMVAIVETGDCWLRYRAPDPALTNPQVIRRLTGAGLDIVTLSEVSRTLEDVYLQIVAEDEGTASHDRSE
jgi:ABC-2 type transport system ATP-binding protein